MPNETPQAVEAVAAIIREHHKTVVREPDHSTETRKTFHSGDRKAAELIIATITTPPPASNEVERREPDANRNPYRSKSTMLLVSNEHAELIARFIDPNAAECRDKVLSGVELWTEKRGHRYEYWANRWAVDAKHRWEDALRRAADALQALSVASPRVVELEAALVAARGFAVLFLAFAGRDRGTERMEGTLDDLVELAKEADLQAVEALSRTTLDQG